MFGIPPLTARDAAAPDVTDVQTLSTQRTDNPLGVVAPTANPSVVIPPRVTNSKDVRWCIG